LRSSLPPSPRRACKYSAHNGFSFGRARSAIAAFKKAFREQAKQLTATKDASAIATWASEAIDVASGAHWFDDGLTNYVEECKGIAGKAAAAALRGAWGKSATADVKAILVSAAENAPKKDAGAGAGAAAAAAGGDEAEVSLA
jgi:hypothetical protein